MAMDINKMRDAFNSWLLSRVSRGEWSRFAKAVWKDVRDPVRKFGRLRNEHEKWTLEDMTLVANYFDLDLGELSREVMGVYRTQIPEKKVQKKHQAV